MCVWISYVTRCNLLNAPWGHQALTWRIFYPSIWYSVPGFQNLIIHPCMRIRMWTCLYMCVYICVYVCIWRVCLQNASYPKLEFRDNRIFIFYCQCVWCKNEFFMGASQWEIVKFNIKEVWNIRIRLAATRFHRYLNFFKLAHDAFCKQTLHMYLLGKKQIVVAWPV